MTQKKRPKAQVKKKSTPKSTPKAVKAAPKVLEEGDEHLQQITIRLPRETIGRTTALSTEIGKKSGIPPTRADVVRLAIERGIELLETEYSLKKKVAA